MMWLANRRDSAGRTEDGVEGVGGICGRNETGRRGNVTQRSGQAGVVQAGDIFRLSLNGLHDELTSIYAAMNVAYSVSSSAGMF